MKRTNINTVMKMVRMYLDGRMNRTELSLDFPHELVQRYGKMKSEDREYAELIHDRLLEDGVYAGEDLSDEDFHDLMECQYKDVLDIVSEGFC